MDSFLSKLQTLKRDFFKNYYELEEMVDLKLQLNGAEYFIKNNCYSILGKFESTLSEYCKICSELYESKIFDDDFGLLLSYLHLNDVKNVKRIKNLMKKKKDNYYFIIKDYDGFQCSCENLKGNIVSIKFDKRVENFAKYIFEDIPKVEEFIISEWKSLLPPRIFITLLYCDGPGPYNANMNASYFPVKSMKNIKKHKELYTAGIIHETFHLVNYNLVNNKCRFQVDDETYAYKFLDEGYAELIESKYLDCTIKKRTFADEYTRKIIKKNQFKLDDLKNKWDELFNDEVNHLSISTYRLATSFAFFLKDKFGEEKYKNLFIMVPEYHADSWIEYVEKYFQFKLDDLMEEWKIKINK